MNYDVLIVGAGPAGSSLAVHLARQGRRCALVDGAHFPRPKVCGEGLMPHGLAALRELGIEPRGAPFSGLRYVLADGTAASSRFGEGLAGLGVQRSWLDEQLVRRAQAEPRVDVRLGRWAREIKLAGAGREASLRLGGETLRAPLLVGADGCRSRIRRLAGLEAPPPRRLRFGVGGHFAHPPRPEDPTVEVVLGAGHELYITPVAPELSCVALLTDRAGLKPLQGDLEGGLRAALRAGAGRCPRLAEAPRVGPVRALGPLALQATRAHAAGLILVGDAAGALDPITGEGVSLALVTSKLASEVLEPALAAGDLSAPRLAAWTRHRRRAVRGLEHLTRALLYLSARPRKAERVVRALAARPDTLKRLLAVAAGAPFSSLRLRDGLRLLVA